MSFNLESGKNKEINETPLEVKVDSEQLSETEETAEKFDDCSLNEVRDSKENEVNIMWTARFICVNMSKLKEISVPRSCK